MSIGLKSDSSGTSGSIVINGSDAVLVTPTGITTASIQDSSITTAKIANGNITTAKIADGNITYGKLSTSSTEADNVAKRTAKAWVNFDGTNAFSPNPSTTAIRSSFNVSSITDNGTGDYTINFTAALTDGNYAVFGTGQGIGISDGACVWIKDSTTPTSSAVNILTGQPGRSGVNSLIALDSIFVSVLIFR